MESPFREAPEFLFPENRASDLLTLFYTAYYAQSTMGAVMSASVSASLHTESSLC